MSDRYRTLGVQPNASKSDIRNTYFRLAHRYHPNHHAQADAAGRAAKAALFHRAKDAYDVLSDDICCAE
jgi:DnaJ-class molecular chaperone